MKKLITICTAVELIVFVTSVTYAALPSDNFDDNSMNTSMWILYQENPVKVWMEEINQRLELRSAANVKYSVAVYFSNGWGLRTTDNFSLKVDLHNSSTSGPYYSSLDVMFGIGKGVDDLGTISNNNVTIGASHYLDSQTNSRSFYYSTTTNGIEDGNQEDRNQNDGTLYISYDASIDKIYLSLTGYWADDALWTAEGVLQGEWGSTVVSPFLGGRVDNRVLDSGDAYLDNFVVESGTVVPEPATVCLLGLGGLLLSRNRKFNKK